MEILYGTIKRKSAKAILIEFPIQVEGHGQVDTEVWLPKSQIRNLGKQDGSGAWSKIRLPGWLFRKKIAEANRKAELAVAEPEAWDGRTPTLSVVPDAGELAVFNSFEIKDKLKARGFKFDRVTKAWYIKARGEKAGLIINWLIARGVVISDEGQVNALVSQEIAA